MYLFSEGQLDEVKNLTIAIAANFSIYISWLAPFSLDVTPTDTETGIISYYVEVYNHTDQVLLDSACGLTDTQYTYLHHGMLDPSPCDSVDILVIPVNSAGNGSSSHLRGGFYDGN